jgi:hypothetical protein
VDDLDYHLLAWLEDGHAVFRPAERTEASRQEFQRVAQRIFDLRARSLIDFRDNHVSRAESGDYLVIGPCHLSTEGRAALVRDRRPGARPPQSHDRPSPGDEP